MNRTFEEIAQMWLEVELFGKQYLYRKELESGVNHLTKFFYGIDCDKINGADVDKFVKYEVENANPNTGKPFSKKTLKEHINIGQNIYEYALENNLVNCRNPFIKKKRKIPKNAPESRREPINKIQEDLIMKVGHKTQIASLIMLFCGLRRGELIPLTWSDIDFVTKQIAVTKSVSQIDYNNFSIKPHTKNGKDRYIPIPDNLLAYLKLEKYNSNGHGLIYSQKSGKLHTVTSWKKSWNSYQKSLNYRLYADYMKKIGEEPKAYCSPTGIPEIMERFTAHQLRHTYCTMLYKAGVDILTASKLMGHSNVQITLEIYTHLDEKYKRLNIDKFNNYINQHISNNLNTVI